MGRRISKSYVFEYMNILIDRTYNRIDSVVPGTHRDGHMDRQTDKQIDIHWEPFTEVRKHTMPLFVCVIYFWKRLSDVSRFVIAFSAFLLIDRS